MTRAAWIGAAALLAVGALSARGASADDAEGPKVGAPRAAAPSVEPGRIVASARAALDESGDSYALRRTRARKAAAGNACRAIHAFVDERLAQSPVTPRVLTALHEAVDAHCAVVATSPTIDGGAVVQVAVPLEALREAAPLEAAPW